MHTIFTALGLHLLVLAIFYGFYQLFLSRETFFHLNRWVLLLGIGASIVLPFFRPTYSVPFEPAGPVGQWGPVAVTPVEPVVIPEAASTDQWRSIVLVFYAGVALLMFIRWIWQVCVIFSEAKRKGRIRLDGIWVVDTNRYPAPFSFFHLAFIDLQRYEAEERSNIVAHEKAHVRQYHWVDLFLIQLLEIVAWINPVVWWYEKAIQRNHEFLADAAVLGQGSDRRQYQTLVLQQMLGGSSIRMASHFFDHLHKNRFQMMNQTRSNPFRKLKVAGILPLLAMALWTFAQPVTQPAATPGSKKVQPVSTAELTVKGEVVDAGTGAPATGASVIISNTTSGTVVDEKGNFTIKVNPGAILAISYVGYETAHLLVQSESFLEVRLSPKYYTLRPGEAAPAARKSASDEKEVSGEMFQVVEALPYYGDPSNQLLFTEVNAAIKMYTTQSIESGLVTVHFTVDASGKVTDVYTLESSNPKLNEVAENIIRALKPWAPGKQRGKAVETRLRLALQFE